MRVLRSLSVLALLVPGLLAAPVVGPAVTASAAPAPKAVAPVVSELKVSGVTGSHAAMSLPAPSGARTVLLTEQRATQPFSVVGVTWAADPSVSDVQASVRTRTGGRWSAWQTLGGTADEQPDPGSADARRSRRGGTAPLWVDSADGIQARVDVRSGSSPRDLRLSLVDPGTSPADADGVTKLAVASATSGVPVIHSRGAWGADESVRTAAPSYATGIHAVTVHHTATANDYSAADVPRLLRGFYAYHVKSNGWSDLGYNFLVDKYGRIWEGRAGGTRRAVIGSHAGGFNTGTVGISMIGTFENVAPSAAARESVARLAAWRLSAAGKDPASTVRVYSAGSTRFAQGSLVTLPRIFGHRDVSLTSCPGTRGMSALPGIRSRAAALGAGMPPATDPPVPDEAVVPVPTAPVPTAPVPTAPAPTAPVPPPGPPAPASPDGIVVLAPSSVRTGASVPVTVSGGAAGAPVELWFSRRGDTTSTRRRDGRFAVDGTFRTSYVVHDVYTVLAVSGARTSARVTTSVSALPALVRPAAPRLRITAPARADAGSSVPVTVTGTAGAPVDLWLRRRGSVGWSRLAAGRLDAGGRWSTTYLGSDDVEYWASSQGVSSPDGGTLATPVLRGPASAAFGARVELTGRARPGDEVVVESRRRGSTAVTRTTLLPDGTGAFRTTYAADDEYEHRVIAGSRTSALQRTTVAPTALAAPARRGDPVQINGTARPGAEVQLLFSRGTPSVAVAGRRPRAVTPYTVGRVLTAGSDGRWTATWTSAGGSHWYARSDGNTSALQSTAPR